MMRFETHRVASARLTTDLRPFASSTAPIHHAPVWERAKCRFSTWRSTSVFGDEVTYREVGKRSPARISRCSSCRRAEETRDRGPEVKQCKPDALHSLDLLAISDQHRKEMGYAVIHRVFRQAGTV